MTYAPQDVDDFVPPQQTDSGSLAGVWNNHQEVMLAYEQWLGSFAGLYETDGANELLWRFRQRGGEGLGDVVADIITVASSGTYDIELRNAANTTSDSATGIGSGTTTTTLAVAPVVEDDYYEIGVTRVTGSSHKELQAFCIHSEAPATPTDVPGFRPKDGSFNWLQPDYAIAVEHMTRLLDGPGAIVRDRPHCLFAHFVPTRALALVKAEPDFIIWGRQATAGDTNQPMQVGYGGLLIDGPVARTVHIDAFVLATDNADIQGVIRIGGWSWEPTTGAWDETTVELSPGWHDVVAGIDSTTNNEAGIWHALQIWRS
jgi:hypothetical protein